MTPHNWKLTIRSKSDARVLRYVRRFYLVEALEYITSWRQATESRPAGICGPM